MNVCECVVSICISFYWHALFIAISVHIQVEKQKNNDKMHKLNEALQLVENQLAEVKKQNDKVLAAEIKAR